MQEVNFDVIMTVVWLLVAFLTSPILFVALDFWSGIKKSKQRGLEITSDGWRRSVNKLSKYYNVLLALVVVDILQMSGVWYNDVYFGMKIPIFPILTLAGAVVVGAIEIKSMFEKAEAKEKRDLRMVVELGKEVAKNKTDPAEIAEAIMRYLETKNTSTQTEVDE